MIEMILKGGLIGLAVWTFFMVLSIGYLVYEGWDNPNSVQFDYGRIFLLLAMFISAGVSIGFIVSCFA